MKHAEIHPSESSYVFTLEEGQTVHVTPLGQKAEHLVDAERADRVRQLQQLFAEWTEEDGKLSDEEADRLHVAIAHHPGLGFRSPNLE